MKKIIVANWKMYGSPEMAKAWVAEVRSSLNNNSGQATIVVCPPALLIPLLKEELAGLPLALGGQDCHEKPEGAHTGDTSAALLKALGAGYVIVGHSERRTNHCESDKIVCGKAKAAIAAGLDPIICIGETASQRDNGETIAVLKGQVEGSVPKDAGAEKIILAYEPVWAIGSGKIPSAEEIRAAHLAIISATAKHAGLAESNIHVLYGGSVKPENAREILETEGVFGVLVGGASLKAGEFFKISASALVKE